MDVKVLPHTQVSIQSSLRSMYIAQAGTNNQSSNLAYENEHLLKLSVPTAGKYDYQYMFWI